MDALYIHISTHSTPAHSLGNDNQQDEYDNQNDNDGQTPILPRLSRKAIEPAPRSYKLGRMAIHALFHIIQQHHLAVELIPNLHAEFALAANTRAEGIELVVLVGDDAAVVGMDLLVVKVRVVWWCGVVGGRGVVAVREQGGAGCGFGGRWGPGGVGVCVGEADGFVGLWF